MSADEELSDDADGAGIVDEFYDLVFGKGIVFVFAAPNLVCSATNLNQMISWRFQIPVGNF